MDRFLKLRKSLLLLGFALLFTGAVSILYFCGLSLPKDGVLLSEHGNLMWYNRPAIYTYGENNYIGYMTSKRAVYLGKIGLESGELIDSVQLHKWRYLDDHGAPIVHVAEDGVHKGKIIAIYALHNSEIYFRRSRLPESLDSWEDEIIINKGECTYPSLLEIGGVLYLFYRKQVNSTTLTRSYFMMTSSDYGDTWGDETEIIKANEGTWIYAFVDKSADDVIHLAWGVFDPDFSEVRNIYYAYSNDLGKTWDNSASAKGVNTLESNREYMVSESSGNMATRLWDMRVDDEHIAILYVDYDNSKVSGRWMAKTSNGSWSSIDLGQSTMAYYPCGLVFSGKAGVNDIYIARKQRGGRSTIDRIRINKQNGSWSVEDHIENRSEYDYCRPMTIGEGKLDLVFTVIKEYKGFMDFDTTLVGLSH